MKKRYEKPSTQILYSTVPIFVETNDGVKTGTAHFITYQESGSDEKNYPLLVTCAHVVENAIRAQIKLSYSDSEGGDPERVGLVDLDPVFLESMAIYKEHDIAIMPAFPISKSLIDDKKFPFYRAIPNSLFLNDEEVESLMAIEDVIFIGYPKGMMDNDSNIPVLRRGVTATPIWNDYNGERIFLIDAGVFPGSSGSPVLIYNEGSYATDDGIAIGTRVKYLGVLSSSFIIKEDVYLGLGSVIKSNLINVLAKEYLKSIGVKFSNP